MQVLHDFLNTKKQAEAHFTGHVFLESSFRLCLYAGNRVNNWREKVELESGKRNL